MEALKLGVVINILSVNGGLLGIANHEIYFSRRPSVGEFLCLTPNVEIRKDRTRVSFIVIDVFEPSEVARESGISWMVQCDSDPEETLESAGALIEALEGKGFFFNISR